ncbi:hypothetical protein THRCLA_04877 [Thraustotheca clavata]|uniref:RING-type domain-containing protein n=1 Tax=Thraustotheca clavata TaxID=74557 RepID=A0A1V9ZXU4_9STRA|nr:hypothetical protein THRCLA_04877 [Thraustotheca clavata]
MERATFDCPPLGQSAIDHWNNASIEACIETIQAVEAVRAYPVYKLHRDQRTGLEMTLYAGAEPGNPNNHALCGYTRFQATLAEVSQAFQRVTFNDKDAFVKMLGYPILDTQTLYSIMEPSEANPMQYTGIEWSVFQGPRINDAISTHDLCFLESQNQFFHQGQQRMGWVRSLHSIELDACPPFPLDANVHRAQVFQTGQVFIETEEPGVLDCYSVCVLELPYSMAKPDHLLYLTTWVIQMLSLQKHILKLKNQKPQDVDICPWCHGNIPTTAAICQGCNHRICEKCSPKWSITSVWRRLSKAQLCAECSEDYTERSDRSNSVGATPKSSGLLSNFVASAKEIETVWIDVSSVGVAPSAAHVDIPVARAAPNHQEEDNTESVKLHQLLDTLHGNKVNQDPRIQNLYKDLKALDK